jgi:hypothetical protein
MVRVTRADLPPAPIIVVTLTDGTDDVDERVLSLAHAEAESAGVRIGAYFGILDEPDAQLMRSCCATCSLSIKACVT